MLQQVSKKKAARVSPISEIPKHAISLFKTELAHRLPWLYRLFPLRAQSANINITDRCCFKCVMCNQWSGPVKYELSTDEWRGVLRQLKDVGVKRVNISGGEPLLRSDIAELVGFATSLNFGTTLLTNGFLLDEMMLCRLVESGLGSISISIDGIGKDFEKVRGIPGSYEKVERACRLIAQAVQRNQVGATVSFVLMKETIDHLKEVLELRRCLRLPLVINLADFTPYFFVGGNKERFWINDPDDIARVQNMLVAEKAEDPGSVTLLYSEIDFIRHYFSDPLQKRIPCVASQERICIDSEGKVFGGCWSMGTFGNVREQPLKDILHSPNYRMIHKRMFFKKCPGCSCSYAVNLRNSSLFIMREILFRLFSPLRKRIAS